MTDEKILEIIQAIINDSSKDSKEKLETLSKNLKEDILIKEKERDIEIIKTLNEKIFRTFFYKNLDLEKLELKEIITVQGYWMGIKLRENLFNSHNKKEIKTDLLDEGLKLNLELKERYLKIENNFKDEVIKSLEMIKILSKDKDFFLNNNIRKNFYKNLQNLYDELVYLSKNEYYGNFKTLKNKIQNL